jgi:hypothetical protein
VSVRLASKHYDAIYALAREARCSFGDLFRAAIADYVRKPPAK